MSVTKVTHLVEIHKYITWTVIQQYSDVKMQHNIIVNDNIMGEGVNLINNGHFGSNELSVNKPNIIRHFARLFLYLDSTACVTATS